MASSLDLSKQAKTSSFRFSKTLYHSILAGIGKALSSFSGAINVAILRVCDVWCSRATCYGARLKTVALKTAYDALLVSDSYKNAELAALPAKKA